MKNVTLSAEEELIEQARQIARAKHTTLNQAFREWLADYTARESGLREYRAVIILPNRECGPDASSRETR